MAALQQLQLRPNSLCLAPVAETTLTPRVALCFTCLADRAYYAYNSSLCAFHSSATSILHAATNTITLYQQLCIDS
jgi:hypothetical protein